MIVQYKNFQLFEDLDSIFPITSINVEKCSVSDEITIPLMDAFKNEYMNMCQKMISEQHIPCISIEEDEKIKIIEYINKAHNKKFDQLQYIGNLGLKTQGFIDFGFFSEDSDQINIIERNNCKYIYYNKEILKMNKNKKIESVKEGEKNKIKTDESIWDLYLLEKKRTRPSIKE